VDFHIRALRQTAWQAIPASVAAAGQAAVPLMRVVVALTEVGGRRKMVRVVAAVAACKKTLILLTTLEATAGRLTQIHQAGVRLL
jgi:hypothetical protein